MKWFYSDNAGEHQTKLGAACHCHGIAMEYTAPETPQQNGIVECRFATGGDKALVMMLAGQLKPEIQKLVGAEATNCPSLQMNLMINMARNEPHQDGIADQEEVMEDQERESGRTPPHVIGNDKPEPDPPGGRNAHPEQEMIPEHLAGRRMTGNNGNNGDSADEEAGRKIFEEDNNDDNAVIEVDQNPPMAHTLSPNARCAKSRKVANVREKLQGCYTPLATETLDKTREGAVIKKEDDLTKTEEEVEGVVFSTLLNSDPGEPQTFREAIKEPAKDKLIPSTKDKVLDYINKDAWKKRERLAVAGKFKRVQRLYKMIEKRFTFDILGKLKTHLGV
jgi:hypothetical protein